MIALPMDTRDAGHNRRKVNGLPAGDAAEVLDVSVKTVGRYFDQGILSGHTLPGGQRRISIASLRSLAISRSVPDVEQRLLEVLARKAKRASRRPSPATDQ